MSAGPHFVARSACSLKSPAVKEDPEVSLTRRRMGVAGKVRSERKVKC